ALSVSKLLSDKASMARLCAACPIWPYRRDIRTVVLALHPMTDATTENGMPPSSMRVHPVCRRSWKQHVIPATFFAVSQASFQRPIGFVGSVLCTQGCVVPLCSSLRWARPYFSYGKT